MDADDLRAIEDEFSSALFAYLVDKEPDLTRLQDKVYTCQWLSLNMTTEGSQGCSTRRCAKRVV